MKKVISFVLTILLIAALSACSGTSVVSIDTSSTVEQAAASGQDSGETALTQPTTQAAANPIAVEYDPEDLEASASGAVTASIHLQGDSISLEGTGATVDGSRVTITAAGTYSIRGVLHDGQIKVETADEEAVVLLLDGVDITCSTSAPIYISNAEKAVITLAAGTENVVSDGTGYVFEDAETDEPNAAIFSKDDLTLNGSGSLTVNANYNNGIASKDDLKITSGTFFINAVNDGIKGRNYIAIKDGTFTIQAGGDGLQSNNDEDVEKGYVLIEGGWLEITAGLDGIQAETRLLVSGGGLTISSGGGSSNGSRSANWGNWGAGNNTGTAENATSAKGLKAGADLTINGGVVHIDSSDDALHSNGSLAVNGGEIVIASGDDGLHADSSLVINGGDLTITQSYEGIESAAISITGGTIHLVASDDGINAAGGADGSSLGGRPGQNAFAASGDYHLTISGGYLYVDAGGDGLDANGTMEMSGGVVLVNGPTDNGNGPLDYLGSFNVTGGFLVAVGSSGMAQAPSATSTQYSVMHNFQSTQAAGTLVHIESADGANILTFMPGKSYQSVLVSSPELQNGATYAVYTAGSASGTASDGLYMDGTYTPGTQVTSFTISSMVTGGGGGMGGFPTGPGGGNRPPKP